MIWRRKRADRKMNRLAGLLLAVSLVFGLSGMMIPSVQAASWMDYYLEKVVDWGVMRGDIDGNLEPDRPITRAEFVCMVNRAYGYTEVLPVPFTDVAPEDWFYEDICIAYHAGYFAGDSETTASPNGLLTREQAAVLISNNMMLENETGEALGFSDSRDFASWSRHRIQAVAREGVLSGYPDGSFKPQEPITRGQVAVMLVKAVGTPIQESGEVSLGGVYGNVTITAPGVKLKDTTIYGDLYVAGGVGLSNVGLENVTVQGKIVVSGSGESEKGEHSILLRNVKAEELVMDSMQNKFVTLKADGLTSIEKVNVRTGSYLEDVTSDGMGLKQINLDGESGTRFQLAGNIKDVLNLTQASTVTLAQGIAKEITIDEKAVGSNLNLDKDTVVNKVNLDAASTVTGVGSIGHMNVNVSGCTSSILPDTITVRPGITANINGEVMDSVAAQESSEDPRILSGYPKGRNVASATADVYFKTNKKGTIYWALTALADGTVGEEELLTPGEYSGVIIKSGTVAAQSSNTEFMAKMTGLTKDGSYYVSAMLVDNRGLRSPVKITAFTTPDDTVPAFASGYPQVSVVDSDDDEQIVQALVMPNKNCKMYYTLLPKGSVAPTAADFKANAVTGNLGYGVVELQKNTPYLVPRVNAVYLEEQTEYELYLWLTDADGRLSSAVKKVSVTTLDRTPPKIEYMALDGVTGNSVTLRYAVNEPATLYWVVVKEGGKFYIDESIHNDWDRMQSEEAKAQIISGINALKDGSSNVSKESTPVKLTISGLEPETAYDVYYVAVDKAGNYCIYDKAIDLPYTVYTLDNAGPTVTQEFSHDGTNEGQAPTPYPDTSISLIFSENVQGMLDIIDEDGNPDGYVFLDEYRRAQESGDDETKENFAQMLSEYIKLYDMADGAEVPARNEENPDGSWVIDYRKAKLQLDPAGTGNLIVTFPYNADMRNSALNLSGGKTYQFRMEGFADTSVAANRMQGVKGITSLPQFTVISAQIVLSKAYEEAPEDTDWNFDMSFKAKPVSHQSMADEICWDLIIWSDSSIRFKMYESKDNGDTWEQITSDTNPFGEAEITILSSGSQLYGVSIGSKLRDKDFEQLNELEETLYSIEITSISGVTDRENFNTPVTVHVSNVTGYNGALEELGNGLESGGYNETIGNNTDVSDITVPVKPMEFSMTKTFMDNTSPSFQDGFPKFKVGDSSVEIEVALKRPNSRFYYAIAPLGKMVTVIDEHSGRSDRVPYRVDSSANRDNWKLLPEDGEEAQNPIYGYALAGGDPNSLTLMKECDKNSASDFGDIKYGVEEFNNAVISCKKEELTPNTEYIAYFVLQGESQSSYSPKVYCFRFKTGDVEPPVIILNEDSPNVGVKTSTNANVTWIFLASTRVETQQILGLSFYDYIGLNRNDTVIEGSESVQLEEKREAFKKQFDTYFPKIAANHPVGAEKTEDYYKQAKVIDAMVAYIGKIDTMSVFDYYANDNIYKLVQQSILESTGDAYLQGRGQLNTQKDVAISVPLEEKMSGITQHYFVAAAQNVLGGPFSFKAVGEVHLQDKTPPSVKVNTTIKTINGRDLNLWNSKDLENVYTFPGLYTYGGMVTLTFDEVPYQVFDKGGNDIESVPLDVSTIESIITHTGIITSVTLQNEVITIGFENARMDDMMTFFTQGTIGDIHGAAHKEKLQLTFSTPVVNVSDKQTFPKFTPETWPK